MRNLFKSLVPILLIISMIFSLGIEGISVDNPITENTIKQGETLTDPPKEEVKDNPKEETQIPQQPQIPKEPDKEPQNPQDSESTPEPNLPEIPTKPENPKEEVKEDPKEPDIPKEEPKEDPKEEPETPEEPKEEIVEEEEEIIEDELAENIPPIAGEPEIVLPDFYYQEMMRPSLLTSGLTDTIEVDKTASRVPGCRTYEVKLDITGIPQKAPVDVVLVIDRSGSMNETASSNPTRSRLYYAKQAAINFAGKVLGPNGIAGSRVSVVSFSGPSTTTGNGAQNQASTDLGLTSNLSQVTSIINNITAVGGTNTEAGFLQGKSVITNSGNPSSNKVLIMFTDGIPTASNGNRYGPDDPTSHNNHTRAAYTAGQSIWPLADVFTIGLLQNMNASVKALAIDTLTKAQNKGFYNAPSAQDLDQIFTLISQQLGYSATNAVVVDKLGDNFELVLGSLPAGASYNSNTREITWTPGTIVEHSQLKYTIQAKSSFQGGLANTNEYAKLTYKDINGNQGITKIFPKPSVNVPAPLKVSLTDANIKLTTLITLGSGTDPNGENYMSPITGGDGNGTYTYEWRVVGNSTVISTNKNPTVNLSTSPTQYELTVTDSNGCKAKAIMTVEVKGAITITKQVLNPKGLNIDPNQEFDIFLNGPNGVQYVVSLKNGESKTVENLSLGNYIISEIVPMNYKNKSITNANISLNLTNLQSQSIVTNELDNGGWFHDDDIRENKFKVGIVSVPLRQVIIPKELEEVKDGLEKND